jgi:hypothetical protein
MAIRLNRFQQANLSCHGSVRFFSSRFFATLNATMTKQQARTESEVSSWPGLSNNWQIFNEGERLLASTLIKAGQAHVFQVCVVKTTIHFALLPTNWRYLTAAIWVFLSKELAHQSRV